MEKGRMTEPETSKSYALEDIEALERDAARWCQIDYIEGAVRTVRGTCISNNILPVSQLGRLLDEERRRHG